MKTAKRPAFHLLTALLLPAGIAFADFGDPLPGLAPKHINAFNAGLEEFMNVETPETGLGPIFNNNSCASCHVSGAVGGAGPITVTRFGRSVNGVFDPLANLGGSLLQQNAIPGTPQEVVPDQANVIARRQTTALFGLGLIEAIPDGAILNNARRPPNDGIHGRAALVIDVVSGQQRVGHFGWKAQVASLLGFAADAYVNEMGITNFFFQNENVPNGQTPSGPNPDYEDQPDPITGRRDIIPPHSPTPVPVLTVSGAAGAKANSQRTSHTEK